MNTKLYISQDASEQMLVVTGALRTHIEIRRDGHELLTFSFNKAHETEGEPSGLIVKTLQEDGLDAVTISSRLHEYYEFKVQTLQLLTLLTPVDAVESSVGSFGV